MTTTAAAPAEAGSSRTRVEIASKRITEAEMERLAARVVSTAGREAMEVEQPFTGGPIGWVPKCGPDDVRAAIDRRALRATGLRQRLAGASGP